jgi:hypothetical protein
MPLFRSDWATGPDRRGPRPASLIVDPSQTCQSPKGLGRRLTPPPGWTFRAVILDQDLILTPDDGAARITQGDLGNVYDRVEARTATTRREARYAGACGRRTRRVRRSGSKPAPSCLHGATAGDHDRRGRNAGRHQELKWPAGMTAEHAGGDA